jgi:peptide-N4-(N-acetyl-beta-glucosaminyl)asparagine amidase
VNNEKQKLKKFETEQKGREFNFESSIKFGIQRTSQYDDKSIQSKILSRVPVKDIELRTAESMKTSKLDYKDELVKTLLAWFRKEFFSWCDQPICKPCNMKGVHLETQTPSTEEAKWLASRTEVYNCNTCQAKLRFPRYNNPEKLMETMTGRCGEWANCFGAILRAFKYDVRFIDNFEDHVWNEYWSESLRRWIHVDSCETAWDTPLVYEQGWGRNMTYVLAHSMTGVYDVTRRYVKDWDSCEKRRQKKDVDNLARLIDEKNNSLRMNLLEKIDFLLKRDELEKIDFTKSKELKDHEIACRQSGSEEWRKDRGEMK